MEDLVEYFEDAEKIEQGLAQLARILSTYYQLLLEGFNEQQALAVVMQYQALLVASCRQGERN